MTHMEEFVQLFKKAGIDVECTLTNNEKGERVYQILLEAKSQPKIVGYAGFYTEIVFSETGELLYHGAWE